MSKPIDLTDQLFITQDFSVLQALNRMDELKRKLLIVMKGEKFQSVLSIGDIQRAIINKYNLENNIAHLFRKTITVCHLGDTEQFIKEKMIEFRTECMPVLDDEQNLVKLLFWEDIFGDKFKRKTVSLNLPVIIMAGGMGTRLKPLTNVLPKPLLPINEKTIIEDIMDRFVHVGCNEFYLSVNYKAETIKNYFELLNNSAYKINYFEEAKPLGTAGSMFLIKDKIHSTFFVSNCDILIDQDLEEIYDYHKRNNNKITVVSAIKRYKIPYGTLETQQDGILSKLDEKPELVFQINTGMYLLEPEMLQLIPDNQFFHITELIEQVMASDEKVGVFPIAENSWQDIGNWDDYSKILKFKS